MTGRPTRKGPWRRPTLRGRLAGWPTALLIGLLCWTALAVTGGAPVPIASAAPSRADAADFVPTLANLPPGFREDAVDVVGGELQPTIGLTRAFVALDQTRRLVVSVTVGESEPDAQAGIDYRMNQLTRYQGWRFVPGSPYGDTGYRGSRTNADGGTGSMALFRIQAVTAEVSVSTVPGVSDPGLLDNVARLVEGRINTDPDVAIAQPGWPTLPVQVPGTPPVVSAAITSSGLPGAPGAEVTGNASGSPVTGDTVVIFSITGVDRPWAAGSSAPRPPSGMEYLAVEVQIETVGPSEAVVALTDFSVMTYDSRVWTPVSGRSPGLRTGAVNAVSLARGWLTFMVPSNQPALQLTWRLRTNQPIPDGTDDQILTVPLTQGSMATASIGSTPSPAGVPVYPPGVTTVAPTPGILVPSGNPAAPSSGGGSSGGSGSGGGGGSRGGPRLQ